MSGDEAPQLQGQRVRLRAMTDADVRTRAELGRVPEIVRSMGGVLDQHAPMTITEAAEQLGHRFGAGPHWVIADERDRYIGVARLAPIDRHNRSANFAIAIHDPRRLGRGLGGEAAELVLGHAFSGLGLHRVSLTVLAGNERAISAYRKCGFVLEGRLRDALWRDGRWEDDLTMAVLAPDWAKLQRTGTPPTGSAGS